MIFLRRIWRALDARDRRISTVATLVGEIAQKLGYDGWVAQYGDRLEAKADCGVVPERVTQLEAAIFTLADYLRLDAAALKKGRAAALGDPDLRAVLLDWWDSPARLEGFDKRIKALSGSVEDQACRMSKLEEASRRKLRKPAKKKVRRHR